MTAVAKGKSKGLIGKLTGSLRKKKAKATDTSAVSKASPFERQSQSTEPQNWSTGRLNVVEKLWGMGFVTAGGMERIKQLAPLLHLNEKKSLLLLGAGLGGISETLIEETGVWITGYEPDPELAKMGRESMLRAGLKRKAPINHHSLKELKLKPKSFDAMLSLDTVHFVENKQALFTAVTQSLRVGAEMIFVCLVLPDTNPPGPLVQAWAGQQPQTPHVWPGEAMLAMLNTLDLDVRPPNDVTRDYRNCVLKAWINFLSTMNRAELQDKAQDVVAECARWAALITALDRGALKVLRFSCTRIAERRKSVEELLEEAKAAESKG